MSSLSNEDHLRHLCELLIEDLALAELDATCRDHEIDRLEETIGALGEGIMEPAKLRLEVTRRLAARDREPNSTSATPAELEGSLRIVRTLAASGDANALALYRRYVQERRAEGPLICDGSDDFSYAHGMRSCAFEKASAA